MGEDECPPEPLPAYGPEAVLIVSRSYSTCGHCHREAFPDQETHATLAGYGGQGRPGCGALFVAITTGYVMTGDWQADLKRLRPDLPITEDR